MSKLLDVLFGCSHKRCTFPMSTKRGHCSEAAATTGTYVVCLDCGKEFPYDWRQMKMLASGVRNDSGNIAGTAEVADRAA